MPPDTAPVTAAGSDRLLGARRALPDKDRSACLKPPKPVVPVRRGDDSAAARVRPPSDRLLAADRCRPAPAPVKDAKGPARPPSERLLGANKLNARDRPASLQAPAPTKPVPSHAGVGAHARPPSQRLLGAAETNEVEVAIPAEVNVPREKPPSDRLLGAHVKLPPEQRPASLRPPVLVKPVPYTPPSANVPAPSDRLLRLRRTSTAQADTAAPDANPASGTTKRNPFAYPTSMRPIVVYVNMTELYRETRRQYVS